MKIDVIDIEMVLVCMQFKVGVGEGASLVRMLVAMRILMRAAVTVRVGMNGVGVVVVSALICVGNVSVILISRIAMVAMATVQMVRVGHISVILVRGGFALVVVIAMLHIPEVAVRWLLRRGIEMARA